MPSSLLLRAALARVHEGRSSHAYQPHLGSYLVYILRFSQRPRGSPRGQHHHHPNGGPPWRCSTRACVGGQASPKHAGHASRRRSLGRPRIPTVIASRPGRSLNKICSVSGILGNTAERAQLRRRRLRRRARARERRGGGAR
ncbi:unnamed protein product [Prorocentrum cordatum]|uniref:Uncharacterized protein n=1 Tax=Prorocentrum cordatum TaxID=2364126 RepID=A0ABN9PGZ1_9DINO|nr:unnamed protein product [Polarella glacialis]